MIVTAWKGGNADKTKPAGYGLKIQLADRDEYFYRQWKTVFIHLEGVRDPAEVNIDKDSFWNESCHELIQRDIGQWLLANDLAPWPDNQPPKLELIQVKDNHFKVIKSNSLSRGDAPTTAPCFLNSHGQKNLGRREPPLEGNDNFQFVYVLNCTKCGYVYGANGSDIHLRKCPKCQAGNKGLDLY